jgi:hypothetical protein
MVQPWAKHSSEANIEAESHRPETKDAGEIAGEKQKHHPAARLDHACVALCPQPRTEAKTRLQSFVKLCGTIPQNT